MGRRVFGFLRPQILLNLRSALDSPQSADINKIGVHPHSAARKATLSRGRYAKIWVSLGEGRWPIYRTEGRRPLSGSARGKEKMTGYEGTHDPDGPVL